MMIAFVGHRGVGKTSLLKRIQSYYHEKSCELQVLDLDFEIEKRTGRSIADIFSKDGEASFRRIEGEVLQALYDELTEVPTFVALGAGYKASVPKGVHVIWVQRSSDVNGRVFTDRPRLDPNETPLSEYFSRWEERQERYRKVSNEVLLLNEGEKTSLAEKHFFLNNIKLPMGSAITLFPHNLSSPNFKGFIQKRVEWGYRFFELRDDLLTKEQVDLALKVIPNDRVLLSVRKKESYLLSLLSDEYAWDWALELGPPPKEVPTIVSLHELQAEENFAQALSRLSLAANGAIQKCALPVSQWSEIQQGHEWSMAEKNRSFLPRSEDGRWQWYRWLALASAPISFIKEDTQSSAADQPSLLEAATRGEFSEELEFAAILGWPVDHSWTPSEQQEFFVKRAAPVLRVPVKKNEVSKALSILKNFGLRWAAVTAPLKQDVYKECSSHSDRAEKLGSVNTLQLVGTSWVGHNTDWDGLQQLFLSIPLIASVAVWGGGGTLELIKELLPQAKLYSARTGKPRTEDTVEESPDIVVWACGRFEGMTWPSSNWHPKKVIDLSYAANSAGKEYALLSKAEYLSGESMFFTQAKQQRRFWNESSK